MQAHLPGPRPGLRAALAVATLCGACVGSVADGVGTDDEPSTPAGPPAGPAPRPGVEMPPAPGGGVTPPPPPGALPFPVQLDGTPTSLRRLSRDEIVASAQALVGAAPRRDELPEEPRPEPAALLTGGLTFLASELGKLQIALADVALKAAPAALTASGCATTGEAQRECLTRHAVGIAERGWRRALDPTETARFRKLVEAAGTSRDLDLVAMEGVLTAVLVSPSFLYRTEIGAPVAGRPGVRALGAMEIATRLSFLATLGPPDAELIEAARAGRLAMGTERTRHLKRLIETERGRKAMAVLVLEWLGAGEARATSKSSKYLSGLPGDVDTQNRASAEATVRKVLASAEPTVGALLTTDTYFADAVVQKVRLPAGMGKTASADPDPTARAGLVMHPHVLTAHTKEDGVSVFPVGLFLRQALLCERVPPPPPNASADSPTPPPGLTVREDLEIRTSAGAVCRTCHALFSPLGYAFLPFDPVGRWVTQDPSGKPWDLSGSVSTYGGTPVAFRSPGELVRALAERPQVRGCFARAAVEWTLGRHLTEGDTDLLRAASDAAVTTGGNVLAVLDAIVAAPGFVNAVFEVNR